ncbi:MAG: hypothetical protein V3S14_00020 [Anaerolineae bacterium]
MARVVYQDVACGSDLATFEPGQPEAVVAVTIYETTEDPSAIQIAQMHAFMSMLGDRLQIGEYLLVSNARDRTYVGKEDPEAGQRSTLSFILPEGAEELSFDDSGLGERYLERGGGFADTEPVIAGTATVEMLFSYELFDRGWPSPTPLGHWQRGNLWSLLWLPDHNQRCPPHLFRLLRQVQPRPATRRERSASD